MFATARRATLKPVWVSDFGLHFTAECAEFVEKNQKKLCALCVLRGENS